MKRIYAFLISLYLNNAFVICVDIYLIFLFKNITPDTEISLKEIFIIGGLWVFIFIIIAIVNIINAVVKFLKKDISFLIKYTKIVKMGLIPFWIINFIGLTALTIMINMPSHGFGIFFVPIPIMASYFVLIITSIFSILFLLLLFQNKIIDNRKILIYILSQLLFVFDIVFIIYLLRKLKKENIFMMV